MILLQVNEALAQAVDGAGKSNLKWYTQGVVKFFKFLASKDLLQADGINHQIMSDYADWLDSSAASEKKHRLSARTQKTYLDAIKALCRVLVQNGTLLEDPCVGIKPPKQQQRGVRAVSVEDRKAMIDASERSHRDYAMLLCLAYTGIRVEELTKLTAYDIDFSTGRIKVIGKGDKHRVVFAKQPVLDALEKWIRHRPDSPWPHIFISEHYPHSPLQPNSIGHIFVTYARMVKAKRPYSPHAFRHRFAKDLLAAGADIRVVADILGHEDPLFTARIYVQYDDDELQVQYEKYFPEII